MKKFMTLMTGALLMLTACQKEECETPEQVAPIRTPEGISISSFTMLGFNETDANGNYWDSDTNLPDPLVRVYLGNALIYESTVQGSAEFDESYPMNTPVVGVIPVNIPADELATLVLAEHDGGNDYEEIGRFVFEAHYLYRSDNAATFENDTLYGNNGVMVALTGTFNY